MTKNTEAEKPTDNEWFKLILKARELGLSPEEIRYFLENPQSISSKIK
jgi:DNA-binding transcriptional MerR regulator